MTESPDQQLRKFIAKTWPDHAPNTFPGVVIRALDHLDEKIAALQTAASKTTKELRELRAENARLRSRHDKALRTIAAAVAKERKLSNGE